MESIITSTQSKRTIEVLSRFSVLNLFKRDYKNYHGVLRINIYLLRFLFILVFFFVATAAWPHIFDHKGAWENTNAAAWSMWASYSLISFIGIIRPLKLLPIVLFEIIYKITWLIIVAYPLWSRNELTGSPAEGMTRAFLWVVLPMIAMPWRYFFRTYVLGRQTA